MENNKGKIKKTYSKPEIIKVSISQEESVVMACKAGTGFQSGRGGPCGTKYCNAAS